MTWYLFLLLTCGQGCVEIYAVPFDTRLECQRREVSGEGIVAKCEGRFDG